MDSIHHYQPHHYFYNYIPPPSPPLYNNLLLTLCATTAASFPPLVPEGEQLANSPAELKTLFQTLSQRSEITSIAFSPDGQTLATGNEDGSISLWEVATGRERTRLVGPPPHTLLRPSSIAPTGRRWPRGLRITRCACGRWPRKLLWIFTGGQRGVWLSCQSSGKCWRYEDGRRLQTRQADGSLSPLWPPQEAGQLAVTLDQNTLTVPEGMPTELTVTLMAK